MKKLLSMLLLCTVIFMSLAGITVSAAKDIAVYIDNRAVSFDVPPMIVDGRTMVPLRAIFEGLGATVKWDGENQKITAYNDNHRVQATVGVTLMSVNGETKLMDVAPMIVDNRTLVPARFVAEAFDCDVRWDGDNRAVYITTQSESYMPETKGNSAYEKVKNYITRHGDYEDGDYNYFIYSSEGEPMFLLTYYPSEKQISVFRLYESDDHKVTTTLLLVVEEKDNPTILFRSEFSNGTEYKIFGEYTSSNRPYKEILNDIPYSAQEAADNLINTSLALADTYLHIEIGVGLKELGVYFEED